MECDVYRYREPKIVDPAKEKEFRSQLSLLKQTYGEHSSEVMKFVSEYVYDKNTDTIKITAWEGDDHISQIGGNIDWRTTGPLRTEADLRGKKYDVLTMFGCGPSSAISTTEWVDAWYGRSIALLAPHVNDDGLVVMTTSYGGAKKESLLKHLQLNGFEILIAEQNKYRDKLGDKLGFTHDDVIVARKINELPEQTVLDNVANADSEMKKAESRDKRLGLY